MNDERERVEWSFDTGKLMAHLREGARLDLGHMPSLRELADVYGVSASTFSRLDANHQPDLKTLCELCSLLDCEPSTFFRRTVWVVKS